MEGLTKLLGARDGSLRDPLKGFSDDVLRRHIRAEELAGNRCHDRIALSRRALRGHCGRGANANQLGIQALPHPPHQHRHIGPLPAAIGMKLVEHQHIQTLCVPNHFLIK